MKSVIQKVSQATSTINGSVFSEIETRLLVLTGIEHADNNEDIEWLSI